GVGAGCDRRVAGRRQRARPPPRRRVAADRARAGTPSDPLPRRSGAGTLRRIVISAPRHRAARALILGAGGIGAILRGIAYLPVADPPRTSQLSPIEGWMPLTAWAALWITVGVALT